MRTATAFLLLVLLTLSAAADTPKADHRVINLVNGKAGFEGMRQKVDPLIAAIGKEKDAARRAALTEAFVGKHGRPAIEVIVRYRGGHLIPVFAALASHEDWSVRRLAILGLQRNFAASELDRIVGRLSDENPLVREIAATTVAILHWAGRKEKASFPKSERKALKGLGKRKKADLTALRAALEGEKDRYVKASLTGAIETFAKRPLLKIHTEQLIGEPTALRVPRVVGGEVRKYQKGSGFAGSGSGRLKPTKGWAYPVLLYPREILTIGSDKPLEPLPKKANSLHFGHDCGWFLEGSSIYAIADGVVRTIRSGGDWGGLIVTEHMAAPKEKVCALNGHCGMWVFVKPGEAVKAGQILGTMALSFSPENGGHGAHDHFGMWEGAFSDGMCYGRSGAGKSTKGWLVPPDYLTPKVEGKPIPPESYK